jgi:elongation factor 2
MADTSTLDKIKELMNKPKNIRNICTSAHIHHGKTALTDNLLAASGYMSKKSAGSLEGGMATWQHSDEQERLLTVDAANVSMIHSWDGEEFLINLIDTPGHVDFGGNVTRAMRAIDGTMVLICAVEGIMPQTEIVVKQALKERVKPVLFINKVDRLINELKLTPEAMQEKFSKIVIDFNRLVERYVPEDLKESFKVNIMDGSVVFGSARENWALSIPFMKKKNVTFKDIYDLYAGSMSYEERQDWTWKNAPLFEAVLDMVTKHLPNPAQAQKHRIPHIWKGDLESEFGKGLLNCDPNSKPAFVITRITIDPKFGREISAGRIFSGRIKEGDKVYLNNAKQYQTVSQVFMYSGVKPEQVGEAVAGNVIALGGVSGYAGETITLEPEQPFEELKHVFEPVITKSIEATKPSDLPKLIEVLRKVSKEDPSIKIEINEETGENLMSGMGELHLEIIENRIKTEKGLEVKTSDPIVVYREAIQKKSQEFEGKSPNKHNKFYIIVEPLEDEIYQAIKNGDIHEGRLKKKDKDVWEKLRALGVDAKEAQKWREIYNGNVLVDKTRGIVHIGEVTEMVMEAFEQVMKEGPLAREPGFRIKVNLMDCKLHEDAIHRGPAQVLPSVRQSLKLAMLDAGAVIYEPVQVLQIEAPQQYLGDLSKLIQNKRGQLIDMEQERDHVTVKAKLPVGEMFGLSSDLRSATAGHGSQCLVDQNFEKLPRELQQKVVNQIRTRKGLKVDEDLQVDETSG